MATPLRFERPSSPPPARSPDQSYPMRSISPYMSISRAGVGNPYHRGSTIPTLSSSNTPLPTVHEGPPSVANSSYATRSPKRSIIMYSRPYPCRQLPCTSKRPTAQAPNGVTHRNTRYNVSNLSRVMKIPRQTMRQLMEAINNNIFSAGKSAETVTPETWTYLTEDEMGPDDICKRLGYIQFPSEAVNAVLQGSRAGFVDDTDPHFLPHFWKRKHWTGYYMYQVYLMCKNRHEENVARHNRRGLGDENTMGLMLQKLDISSTDRMDGDTEDTEEALNIFKSQLPAGKLQQELQQFERVVLQEQHRVNNYQTELYSQILVGIQANNLGITKLYERYCLDKAEMTRLRQDIRDLKNASLGSSVN